MSDMDRDPLEAPDGPSPAVPDVPAVAPDDTMDAAAALAAAETAAAQEALAESPFDESAFVLDPPIRTDMTDMTAAATSEDLANLAAATQAARPIPRPLVPSDGPWEAAAGSTAGTVTVGRTRRRRAAGILTRVGIFALSIALFLGGIAMGVGLADRMKPAPTLVGDLSTGGIAAPAVVKELTDALASNDSDSLRSAVSGDPYRLLAGEMQSWNMQGVTSVETLATMQDGTRSATEIIISGRTADGQPVIFNLVVHVNNNQIVNFR